MVSSVRLGRFRTGGNNQGTRGERRIKSILTSGVILLLATAPMLGFAAAKECNGPLSGTVVGGLVVSDGDFCMLGGANVSGGLKVTSGGILIACASTINGGLVANGAAELIVGAEEIGCGGTVINGGVHVSDTGPGTLQPAPSIALERSAIQGGVFLTGNAGQIAVAGNTIAGGLFCKNNAFDLDAEDLPPTTVTGATTCKFE